jgi:hypothetical protein
MTTNEDPLGGKEEYQAQELVKGNWGEGGLEVFV